VAADGPEDEREGAEGRSKEVTTLDRLDVARQLAKGNRVIDIGGSRMNPGGTSLFDVSYRKIEDAASSYLVVDRDQSADVVCDLSDVDQVRGLTLPAADLVLCMETLEHLRNPGVVCDLIADQVRSGATAYVTLPRQSLFYRHLERHGLGRAWSKCHHLYGFHRHHVDAFVADNFPGVDLSIHACLCKYDWRWPFVWFATWWRGLSWGIVLRRSMS